MRTYRYMAILAAILVAGATQAAAQTAGKTGVTMGYPASVGFIWHVSDKLAIRPELAFAGGATEISGSALGIESDTWNVGTGVSALFYLRTYDHPRTYFSPRLTYTHGSSSSTSSSITSTSSTISSTNVGYSGSFGAQYGLSDKFGVFGELGFGGSHMTSSSSTITSTKNSGNTWGTRSGV